MSIDTKLKDVFADTFELDPSEIAETMSIENCAAWDSMRSITLSFSLEQAFDVVFDDRELMTIDSYAAIRRLLVSKGVS